MRLIQRESYATVLQCIHGVAYVCEIAVNSVTIGPTERYTIGRIIIISNAQLQCSSW